MYRIPICSLPNRRIQRVGFRGGKIPILPFFAGEWQDRNFAATVSQQSRVDNA